MKKKFFKIRSLTFIITFILQNLIIFGIKISCKGLLINGLIYFCFIIGIILAINVKTSNIKLKEFGLGLLYGTITTIILGFILFSLIT